MSGYEVYSSDGKYEILSSTPVPASQVASTPLPLDWTRVSRKNADGEECAEEEAAPRYPIDVIDDIDEFPVDEVDVTIVGTSGAKVTKIGKLEHLTSLKTLILRSHLIFKMEGLSTLTSLTTLELYDNSIPKLVHLEHLTNLITLDISFNSIRSMMPVEHCTKLTHLYIANNKLAEISGLEKLVELKVLDIGANRIRDMSTGLSTCVNLIDLWMGKNKIAKIGGIDNLSKLKRLDVQSNRLESIDNLQGQIQTLEELYLASNGIDDAGASGLKNFNFECLNVIDMSKNKITSLLQFVHIKTLTELWLSENSISTFTAISEYVDSSGPELETIYLEHNPLSRDYEYRLKLKSLIPSLTQIDANQITTEHWGGSSSTPGGGGGGLGGMYGMASMTDAERMKVMQVLQRNAFERAKDQMGEAERKQREKEAAEELEDAKTLEVLGKEKERVNIELEGKRAENGEKAKVEVKKKSVVIGPELPP